MAGVPRAREGQIKAQWGKLADCDPDIVLAWGDGASKSDAHLLHNLISSPRFIPFSNEWEKSFVKELEERGYDITTLKISVEKKRDS